MYRFIKRENNKYFNDYTDTQKNWEYENIFEAYDTIKRELLDGKQELQRYNLDTVDNTISIVVTDDVGCSTILIEMENRKEIMELDEIIKKFKIWK